MKGGEGGRKGIMKRKDEERVGRMHEKKKKRSGNKKARSEERRLIAGKVRGEEKRRD